jgi:hypothetical protein
MGFPMDIGSLLGTLVLVALVIAVIVMMPFAIGKNLMRGHAYRKRLEDQLNDLRLSKMLGFLGLDKSKYLHKQQAMEIRQHMEKCDACGDKAKCDDTLGSETVTPEVDLSFCANIDSLQQIEKESEIVHNQ